MPIQILAADDSATMRRALAITFAVGDFELTEVASADDVLRRAREQHPEIAILDATLPGASGYDLCATLRADEALRGVGVILLTSHFAPYDQELGAKAGVDAAVVKPFDTQVLLDKVAELHTVVAGRGGVTPGAARPAPAPKPEAAVGAPPVAPAAIPASSTALPDEIELDAEMPEPDEEGGPASMTSPSLLPQALIPADFGVAATAAPAKPAAPPKPAVPPPPAPFSPRPAAAPPAPVAATKPAPPAPPPRPATPPAPLAPPAPAKKPAQPAAGAAPRPSLLPGAPVPTSGSKAFALSNLQAQASIRPPAPPPVGATTEAPRPAPSAAAIARIVPTTRPAAAPPPAAPAPTAPPPPAPTTAAPAAPAPTAPPPPAPITVAPAAPAPAAPPHQRPTTLTGMPLVEIGMPDLTKVPPPPASAAPPAPVGPPPAPAVTPGVAPRAAPAAPAALPGVSLPTDASAPIASGIAEAVAGAAASVLKPALAKAVDAKVAEIASRGPEYAAIAALSRDVIEQIAWEVVPELAEVIIRAELDRLVAERGERK